MWQCFTAWGVAMWGIFQRDTQLHLLFLGRMRHRFRRLKDDQCRKGAVMSGARNEEAVCCLMVGAPLISLGTFVSSLVIVSKSVTDSGS